MKSIQDIDYQYYLSYWKEYEKLHDKALDWFVKSFKQEGDLYDLCRIQYKIYSKGANEKLKLAHKHLKQWMT